MFLKIGHRGAAGYEPENTFRSFNKAVALGADMLEFDVRATKDGHIVVIHDPTVDRTTDGEGRVKDLTLQELWRLHCANGEIIPKLEWLLHAFGKKLLLNVELKNQGIAQEVLNLIRTYNCLDFVAVSAFDDPDNEPGDTSNWVDLLWMKRVEPRLKIALLMEKPAQMLRALHLAEAYPIYAVNPAANTVTESFVKEAHRIGCLVMPWTADNTEEIQKLKALGVDGIFSNYPDRL